MGWDAVCLSTGPNVEELGLYEGSALQGVDPKGRVAIPADFRSVIERNSAASKVVIAFHPKLLCLRAYDTRWSLDAEARLKRLALEGMDPAEIDAERESIFGEVERPAFDPSGRFVLPEFFKDEVKIAGWALFQGAGPTFNIWAPEVFMECPDISDRARRRCAHLMATRKARA